MASIVPPTLPPESTAWGRRVESELRQLRTVVNNLAISNQSSNSLSSRVMSSQKQISETLDFLLNQTVVSGVGGIFSDSPTTSTDYDFDPIYDAELKITPSSTGRILLTPACEMELYAPSPEQWYSNAILESVDTGHMFKFGDLQVNSNTARLTNGMFMQRYVMERLNPAREYTFRTRRWLTTIGGTGCIVTWGNCSLSATKLGT